MHDQHVITDRGKVPSSVCLSGARVVARHIVSAAVLDSSHLLLIVAMGIAHAVLARQCKARPTMLCIRLALLFHMLMSVGCLLGEGGEED